MPGKMVVDFLRPGIVDLKTMGLARPRFDELIDLDPALENYDYIFQHDSELPKTEDGTAIKTTAHWYSAPRTRGEYRSAPPAPPFPTLDSIYDE
jgi:hypothetical protein